MDEKAKDLAEAVLAWWKEHKYDACQTADGDEDNVYDYTPDFVVKAAEYLGRDVSGL